MKAVDISVRVAGTSFRVRELTLVTNEVDAGNPVVVRLVEDPGNEHDPNAVKVIAVTMNGEELHVGWIPREEAPKAKEALAQKRVEKVVVEKVGVKVMGPDKPARAWMTLRVSVLPKG